MSKRCTPLWREAHVEVKMLKAPGVRTTFGSWDVKKVHAVVARSTFRSQKYQKKTDGYGALLVVQMCFRVAGARDCAPCQKWAKRESFVAFPKAMAGVGHLKRIFKGACRVAGSTKDMFIRDVRRSGRWFPERSCILEHQIFRFAEMILRDMCSTSYDLASLFRGRRNTFDRWTGKIAKCVGTRLSALHSTFHFWRKPRRIHSFLMLSNSKMRSSRIIASFLMLSTSKNKEVSQNCFVFDVVNFEKWGGLA